MSRPLRIEFPGAVYHVTSRGDRREAIFADDKDRVRFLGVLALALERFEAQVLAYCLMGNHYHLVVRTAQANLSRLMRHVNGVYTQDFNRRHEQVGHLFQGRFKAIVVDSDAYLLRLCAYVELNPVRARLVTRAEDWPWSSCRVHLGLADAPPWLDLHGVARFLLQTGSAPATAVGWNDVASRYARLVDAGQDHPAADTLWQDGLRQQIYLGDADFVLRMQSRAASSASQAPAIPRSQRARPLGLAHWLQVMPSREAALRAAHVESGISMSALARELSLTVGRVSQLIKRAEQAAAGPCAVGSKITD